MAITITDLCINCDLCRPECPNKAIYEGGAEWSMAQGTGVIGTYTLMNGIVTNAVGFHPARAESVYYIVPDKCTECQGFHDEPQCAAVCPVDCCVPDEIYVETLDQLLTKKDRLHVM